MAALLVLAGLAGAFRIKAYDLFWHLAAGRWILEHGRVPRSDPFRFTSGGAPWVDHEWLFQVVAALAERAVGLEGLVLLRAMAAVALAVLLLCALRRSGAPTGWAVPVVLAALLGARPRLFLRPELVTVLAPPVLLTLLQGFRRAATDRVRRATGAAATVLVLIWANLHPGALAAVPVALAHLVGCRVPGGSGAPRRGDRRPSWIVVAGLPAALGATLLATPHGIRIFAVPAAIGRSLEDLPGVNPEWLPLWHPTIARDSLFFFAAVGGLLVLAAVTARRAGRVDPATGLAALALLGLATTSIRHQALAFVGAAFFAGECLADVARASGEAVHHPRAAREAAGAGAPSPRSTALAVVLCVVASLWVIAPPSRGPLVPRQGLYHLGVGLEPERFPVHLTDAVEAEWPRIGNLYNNVAWGGYLLWRLYPPRRVFVDGRNEVDPEILRELAAARRSSSAWNDLLQRYRIDGAVVRYDDRTLQVMTPEAQSGPTSGPAPTARPEAGPGGGHGTRPGAAPTFTRRSPHALLFPRERFALVAWDDAGMLFVRRTPERSDRLAGVEYRALHPEDRAWTLERAAADPAFRRAALAEARRRLAQQPPSERARELYEALVEL
ncbi:MAG: hypothetical protein ACLF0P_11880 [Thermoanaerobaculia bacterium]